MLGVEHEALQQLVGALEPSVRQQALDLVRQVHEHDGVEAISEAPRLALGDGDPAVTHILAWKNGRLAGYSQRDAEGISAELAVAPGARRLGLAKAIVRTLATDTPKVRLWAHGDLGAARMVADSVGMVAVRELREMTSDRTLRQAAAPAALGFAEPGGGFQPQVATATAGRQSEDAHDAVVADPARPADPAPSVAPTLPDAPARPGALAALTAPGRSAEAAGGFVIRQFDPRVDRGVWIELNAAAFASHPEQGKLKVADLDRRMAESWFDPAGLLFAAPVAPNGSLGSPIGYVWTKIVGVIGEIYAIGVHPQAQGRRLGTNLLNAGLARLEEQGVTEVRLFVEADNVPAIAAYRRQGFAVTRRDIQYAFPQPSDGLRA
ncbi:MAG: GNAT family N-acetyltransferase [Bifidobacteriaceae bacterium]|jgi:mycothiol synthase|nr:GNAT family N-acetyltransferase [Bifidobacteriaceae bacterium]